MLQIHRAFRICRSVLSPLATMPPVDLQALPPFGWCYVCAGEIYRAEEPICPRCRKGGVPSGSYQPMPLLYQGERPCKLQ